MDLKRAQRITSEVTVLEVIERYREIESVFRKYDEQEGGYLCCQALFETIGEMAEKYRLNLDQSLSNLEPVNSQ